MPINFLIIQSIRHYGEFYGDELQVECPAGSGNKMNLVQVADELTKEPSPPDVLAPADALARDRWAQGR